MEEKELISTFWDNYEESGIDSALAFVKENSESNDYRELEVAVPQLVQEARDRDIDVIKFLTELDESLAGGNEEVSDASGTDDGTSELSADGSDEADQAQDGDESGSAQDADGEAEQE